MNNCKVLSQKEEETYKFPVVVIKGQDNVGAD